MFANGIALSASATLSDHLCVGAVDRWGEGGFADVLSGSVLFGCRGRRWIWEKRELNRYIIRLGSKRQVLALARGYTVCAACLCACLA